VGFSRGVRDGQFEVEGGAELWSLQTGSGVGSFDFECAVFAGEGEVEVGDRKGWREKGRPLTYWYLNELGFGRAQMGRSFRFEVYLFPRLGKLIRGRGGRKEGVGLF